MAITKVTRTLLSTGIVDNSNATAITIDSSENVGIGTSSPSTITEISGVVPTLTLSDNQNKAWAFGADIARISFFSQDTSGIGGHETGFILNENESDGGSSLSGALVFGTAAYNAAATEAMRIDDSGKVGIGTSSPAAVLEVEGSPVATGDTRYELILSEDNTASAGRGGGLAFARQGVIYGGIKTIQDTSSDSNASMYFQTVTGGSNTNKMKLDSSGNLLVGTTTFNNLSTESGMLTSNSVVMARGALNDHQDACGVLQYLNNATWLRAYGDTTGSGYMVFKIAGGAGSSDTEAMRIISSGNVLIGTTAVGVGTARHNVYNDGTNIASILVNQSGTANGTPIQRLYHYEANSTTSATMIQFLNRSVGQVGSITSTGSATAYNTSSDGRLKDVTGSARGLEVINELNPVSYNWKADGKADEGLIAQEVLDIVPNAVTGSEEDMYSMDYSKLVVHLVAGMKEQQTIIDDLKTRIETLENV